jgi:hypothetical protein
MKYYSIELEKLTLIYNAKANNFEINKIPASTNTILLIRSRDNKLFGAYAKE